MSDRAQRPRPASVPVAAIALAAAIAGGASILLPPELAPLSVALRAVGAIVAPALLGVVLVGLLARRRVLSGRAAAIVLAAGEVAVLAGAVAQLSWGVGFDEADAGAPQSPFARAFMPLLLLGLGAGLLALAVLLHRVLREVRPDVLRTGLAVVIALVAVPTVGLALVQPTSAIAGALVLLVLVVQDGRPPRLACHVPPGPRTPPSAAVMPLVLTTAVAGTLAAVLALTGGAWSGLDGTGAMNVGLAAGALAAVPLAVAVHLLLRRDLRFVRNPGTFMLVAALGVEAASQATGAGAPAQQPLWLLAAVLAGTAGALLLAPLVGLPLRPLPLAGLAAALTLVVGLIGIVVAPLAAPVAAAVTALVLARRRRRRVVLPAA